LATLQPAIEAPVEGTRLPHSVIGALLAFGLIGGTLVAAGRKNYPDLHIILDTSMCLLSGALALLLWDMGTRIARPFPRWIAIGFAATAALEFLHVIVTVEWSGFLAPVAAIRSFLRPATWPPAAHVLPVAVGCSIWLMRRGSAGFLGFALAVIVLGAGLFAAFQWLPTYTPPAGPLGFTRPALILAPMLWAIVGLVCWKLRATDRLLKPLALTAALLFLANTAMLYSQAPHDEIAMVAHLGRGIGYFALLLSLMKIASSDMIERIRAETKLARLNEDLERRVLERTAELQSANETLQGEIAVRRQAEQKVQAQLERLNLLHQITRAIGERQDLNSIFQVVVHCLEGQLPVDFACLCLYDRTDHALTVARVGLHSGALALELAMPERARVDIDENGLSQCVAGKLVYEPDISLVDFPFPRRLAAGGLRSLVAAPLQVESQVFGVIIAARFQAWGFSSGECEFLRQLSEHVALATHQMQLYAALQQAYDDLRRTQQAVMQQERLRALGQMASGIAHDINNALSPVALYTESLLDKEPNLSPRAKEYLETIQRAVEDVAHTVARMKDFYRQREPQLTLTTVRLNELIRQVIDLTRARWSDMPQQQGTVIDVRLEPMADLPPIMGAESEIREALINLVFNAVDALPADGMITLRTKTVRTATDSQNQYVQVEVADNGVGMDEETRLRCLEPFFTTKGERGTGLGLAMVYGVVQRHGAEIEIESAVGEGTLVRLSFPAATVAAITPDQPEAGSMMPRRLRLLVVDDDPLLLKSLRDILESDGHVVVTANDGNAGIEAFRAAKGAGESFAAVITDLGMPYVDGRRVAAAIKAASPSTPVILLTGWGQRLVSEDDIPAHVDRVLSKPPKLREIREALVRYCGPAAR
jgi:signal transduction histidine kinase/ActR/RegA family two-component response regulator